MIIHRGRSVGPGDLRCMVLPQLGHHTRVPSEKGRVLVKRRAEAVHRLEHLDRRHVVKEAEKQAMGLARRRVVGTTNSATKSSPAKASRARGRMTESVFPDPVALAMNTLLAIVPQAALQMSSAFSGAAPLNHTSGTCFSLLPRLHGQELPRPMTTNG